MSNEKKNVEDNDYLMCNSSIRLYYIIVFMEGKQEAVILNQKFR